MPLATMSQLAWFSDDNKLACMLRLEKLITFNITCMVLYVDMDMFNSLLHEYLFLVPVHK